MPSLSRSSARALPRPRRVVQTHRIPRYRRVLVVLLAIAVPTALSTNTSDLCAVTATLIQSPVATARTAWSLVSVWIAALAHRAPPGPHIGQG